MFKCWELEAYHLYLLDGSVSIYTLLQNIHYYMYYDYDYYFVY